MHMSEVVSEVSFLLGLPSVANTESTEIETAVKIAFRELKRYMTTPVDKTVPFSTQLNLRKLGIDTVKVLNVYPSQPRIGLTMGVLDSGNVFQVAQAVNMYSGIGNTSSLNIAPIVTQMAMSQVRNTISTDFQWNYDLPNQIVYCTHREYRPATVTVRYVPEFHDVSEIQNHSWIDYLIRMSAANMKLSWGRARSKYTIEGSNVSLDGNLLLTEANAELEQIREELEKRRVKLIVLN